MLCRERGVLPSPKKFTTGISGLQVEKDVLGEEDGEEEGEEEGRRTGDVEVAVAGAGVDVGGESAMCQAPSRAQTARIKCPAEGAERCAQVTVRSSRDAVILQ